MYELLKAKLGALEAEAFVEILEKRADQKFDKAKLMLATKEDIANLRAELKTDIASSKADMIKWMFIFWIGQLAAFIAIAKIFFSKGM